MHCFYLVEVAVPQNDAFLGWRDFFFGAQGYVGKITARLSNRRDTDRYDGCILKDGQPPI